VIVGRPDLNSEGLVVLTTDSALAAKLDTAERRQDERKDGCGWMDGWMNGRMIDRNILRLIDEKEKERKRKRIIKHILLMFCCCCCILD